MNFDYILQGITFNWVGVTMMLISRFIFDNTIGMIFGGVVMIFGFIWFLIWDKSERPNLLSNKPNPTEVD